MGVSEQDWADYRKEANKREADEYGERWVFVGSSEDIAFDYVEALRLSAHAYGARVETVDFDLFVVFEPEKPVEPKRIELDELRTRLEDKAEEIREIIESYMPSKGDVEEDCQRLCLIHRLNALEYTINGIEEDDLIPDPERDPQYRS